MDDNKKGILVVSFGTSYPETRAKTIDVIEAELKAKFSDRKFYHAFSSGFIVRKLRKNGDSISTVGEALAQAAADGITDLLIQPTHLMYAQEYEKLMLLFRSCREQFASIRVGKPLLADEQDLIDIADRIPELFTMAMEEGTALILMGHGTEHSYNEIYHRLNEVLAERYRNVFVGTVEAKPDLEDVRDFLRKWESAVQTSMTEIDKKVYLAPLLLVAGDHALRDMASDDPESWKSVLTAQGYEVHCILQGLGEFPLIRQIYAAHADAAEVI